MSPTRHTDPPFRALPAQVDLPALEREVLRRWSSSGVFEQSLKQTEGGPSWVFYEGPPTANGQPGVHHVEARVFKDVFPRFKTMKGYHVERKAGWDCHGLPVEVAVEKELGLSGKKDIEEFGIAEFNDRCRESVLRNVDAFTELTERMGYWVDLSQAYRTMDASYVESVWWALKAIHGKGLLVRDFRISPYCPRCGTTLSDHELAQGYETVTDPSVYVRLPLTSGPLSGGADAASLLVWTTTPWTLVSNTAVAVHPEVEYVVATDGAERVVVAEPLLGAALGEGWTATGERFTGAQMERWTYRRPFELVEFAEPAHFVVLADYVTVEDGTGLVHQSPAFGEDDMRTCRAYGLPVVNPVRADGTFEQDLDLVGGVFFKTADATLVADLRERGLLFRHQDYEHSYPHCWRCHTALLYYALPSWYIRTTRIKDRLLAENERTNWYPATIKNGRYGEWLRNNIDWALSRSRYWGTPLPLWECPDSHITCVGSLAELGELAGRELSALDPHRPYVDDVTLPCPECGLTARRVPEVIDAWFDSGSMPFAQWGAPYRNQERFERSYPAQYICEAIDQTRGWFYSLMAVGTLVFDRSSYENVVCLGHILAEDGRKMSKHLGNILEPIPVMERHGADALRWFMAASGSPWAPRRVGHAALEEIVRKVLLTYWNTASFFVLYARAGEGWDPSRAAEAPPYAQRPLLDRWVLAELNRTVGEVDAALEDFDTARAGRRLTEFVDDLSNWYVRRSRRRFWGGAATPEGAAAFATLYECLEVLTRLMAPIVPFLTDYLWDVLRTPDAPESVHLASWPQVRTELLDPQLSERMALARRLVELGRTARATSGVRTRQPLGRAVVGAAGFDALSPELREVIADELNVAELHPLGAVGGELVDYTVKPNFRELGRRFGKQTPKVAAAVGAADPAGLVHRLRADGSVSLTAAELGEVRLEPGELVVTEQPREGWAVAAGAGETLALDLELSPELVRAGLAREVVRLVQDARKSSGLDISDRVDVWWSAADKELRRALTDFGPDIAAEVLAGTFAEGPGGSDATEHGDPDLGLSFRLARRG
ncbi:isoleucine--tRNA ligase [Allonocardiopsis opalescens]|uniref:Isoleucine--tRNA ligase n=1 Tax=Allonocardiopsis opalescens TaxID=1144618 RepID=A0A2T0Q3W5_9ACTN|nr:isoleucine--tRNA ligase [Allonocardiopsis opalescens]PRX98498.1 isoleucyl-tRNA synthetase [Allonocardiopsis opalescens]